MFVLIAHSCKLDKAIGDWPSECDRFSLEKAKQDTIGKLCAPLMYREKPYVLATDNAAAELSTEESSP